MGKEKRQMSEKNEMRGLIGVNMIKYMITGMTCIFEAHHFVNVMNIC